MFICFRIKCCEDVQNVQQTRFMNPSKFIHGTPKCSPMLGMLAEFGFLVSSVTTIPPFTAALATTNESANGFPPFNILLFPLTLKLLCSKYVSDKIHPTFGGNRKYKFISTNPMTSGNQIFFQLMKYFGNWNPSPRFISRPKLSHRLGNLL